VHAALQRIYQKSKEGVVNTQVEFGTLQSVTPLIVKLDTDPTPFEQEELVLFKDEIFKPEDVGARLALMACSNGKYLVLGEVK